MSDEEFEPGENELAARRVYVHTCGHPVAAGDATPAASAHFACRACRETAANERSARKAKTRREVKANPPLGPETRALARRRLTDAGLGYREAEEFLNAITNGAGSARKPRRSDV